MGPALFSRFGHQMHRFFVRLAGRLPS